MLYKYVLTVLKTFSPEIVLSKLISVCRDLHQGFEGLEAEIGFYRSFYDDAYDDEYIDEPIDLKKKKWKTGGHQNLLKCIWTNK